MGSVSSATKAFNDLANSQRKYVSEEYVHRQGARLEEHESHRAPTDPENRASVVQLASNCRCRMVHPGSIPTHARTSAFIMPRDF